MRPIPRIGIGASLTETKTNGKFWIRIRFDSIWPKLYWIRPNLIPLKSLNSDSIRLDSTQANRTIRQFDSVSLSDPLYILLPYITNILRSEISTGQLFLSCSVLSCRPFLCSSLVNANGNSSLYGRKAISRKERYSIKLDQRSLRSRDRNHKMFSWILWTWESH